MWENVYADVKWVEKYSTKFYKYIHIYETFDWKYTNVRLSPSGEINYLLFSSLCFFGLYSSKYAPLLSQGEKIFVLHLLSSIRLMSL